MLNCALVVLEMSLLKKLEALTAVLLIFKASALLAVPQNFVGAETLVSSTVLKLIPCPKLTYPAIAALGANVSLLTIASLLLLA